MIISMKHFNIWDKKFDLFVLILINIFAFFISFLLNANFLESTLLFLGLPSLYLAIVEKKQLGKVLIAAASFGLLFGFCFDFIAEINKAWSWNGGLMFGKIAGVVQVDVMVWFFLWILHVFIFYEHFIDRKKLKSLISARGKWSFVIGTICVGIVLFANSFFPDILIGKKAYLVLCLVSIIPFMLILLYKPKVIWRSISVLPYFFFVYLSHEIVALKLLQWNFPGDYIGMVHMFGVSFPIEELFFWIILSSLVGVSYYEIAYDNSKN